MISIVSSSSTRSSTPHVKAPCEPPPCKANTTLRGVEGDDGCWFMAISVLTPFFRALAGCNRATLGLWAATLSTQLVNCRAQRRAGDLDISAVVGLVQLNQQIHTAGNRQAANK